MTKKYFFDTCGLINRPQLLKGDDKLYITNITLTELEGIKSNKNSDESLKKKCRDILHLLYHKFDEIEWVKYDDLVGDAFISMHSLIPNNDSKIISCYHSLKDPDIVFVTDDLSCLLILKDIFPEAKTLSVYSEKNTYLGYKELVLDTPQEYVDVYDKIEEDLEGANNLKLLENEYLLIRDFSSNKVTDQFKRKDGKLVRLSKVQNFSSFETNKKVRPKDPYQTIAMDSLVSNQMTVLRGAAGSGKSYLAMSYLLDMLKHNRIEKMIIFCNTVATAGSAKLGFYPGTKDEKLLDSQIGNFLISKIGDKARVESMINDGTIMLLPMSDIRGFDTTGMKAGVYITEAQNMDIEMMRLALQRIGDDSICILDGDMAAQVDLKMYDGQSNGLKRVSEVFRGKPFYGEVELKEVYRSQIAAAALEL